MVKDLRKDIIETLTGEKKKKEEIKNKIMLFELNNSGLKNINGGDVWVKNLKISKKNKMITADIILIEEDMGNGHYKKERYNNCKYGFDLFNIKWE